MTLKSRTLYLYLSMSLCISAFFGFLYLDDAARKRKNSKPSPGIVEDISAEIYGAEFLQYNEKGELAASITSIKATHFTRENRIDFFNPHISILSNEDEFVTHVQAGSASLDVDEKILTLYNEVVMKQLNPQGKLLATLKTTALRYQETENFISTDQAVTISRDNAEIHATGLEAWLNQKKMTLLSQVKGHYVPNQN